MAQKVERMEKMKKAMKKTMNRMLVLLLAVSIFAGTLDLNAFAAEPKVVTGGAGWDGVTTQNVCETENLRITYTLSSYWSTRYNIVRYYTGRMAIDLP